MNTPSSKLEAVATRIARETMEVWETHVQSGQRALVESHQESFSVFDRVGIRIEDRSVKKHLAHRDRNEDKVVRRAAREELKKVLSFDKNDKKSKNWVVEAVMRPSTYGPVYVPEVGKALHINLLDVPEVAHPLHLHLETVLSEESGWFRATADALVQISSFDPFGQVGTSDSALVEALINRLDDEDWRVRSAAVNALKEIAPSDPAVTEALIDRLDDEDWRVRRGATEVLKEIAPFDPAVTEALIDRLDDEESRVRSAAANALKEIAPSDPAVTEALIDRLDDEDILGRSAAANALSQIRTSDPAVIDSLTDRLSDDDASVRWSASEALSHIGAYNPAVVKVLFDHLTGESIHGESPHRKRTAEVMATLPWHVVSEAQIGNALRERVDAIRQESTEARIAQTEGEKHLIVHWQTLARLPE